MDTSECSVVIGQRGLEFKHCSIWCKTVVSSSNVRVMVFPIMRFMWYFIDLIPASQRPPKMGALGGIKCHWIPLIESSFNISVERFLYDFGSSYKVRSVAAVHK